MTTTEPKYIRVPELVWSDPCTWCVAHDDGRPTFQTLLCVKLRGKEKDPMCEGHIFILNTIEAKTEYVLQRISGETV